MKESPIESAPDTRQAQSGNADLQQQGAPSSAAARAEGSAQQERRHNLDKSNPYRSLGEPNTMPQCSKNHFWAVRLGVVTASYYAQENNITEKLQRRGLEPRSSAWEAEMIPLHQRCISGLSVILEKIYPEHKVFALGDAFEQWRTQLNVTAEAEPGEDGAPGDEEPEGEPPAATEYGFLKEGDEERHGDTQGLAPATEEQAAAAEMPHADSNEQAEQPSAAEQEDDPLLNAEDTLEPDQTLKSGPQTGCRANSDG